MSYATNDRQDEHVVSDLILELRRQYLAQGANPMSHWEQIGTRLASAERRSHDPRSWLSLMMRSLQISAPSASLALAGDAVFKQFDQRLPAWRRLLQKPGLLMTLARVEAQRRKELGPGVEIGVQLEGGNDGGEEEAAIAGE